MSAGRVEPGAVRADLQAAGDVVVDGVRAVEAAAVVAAVTKAQHAGSDDPALAFWVYGEAKRMPSEAGVFLANMNVISGLERGTRDHGS